MMWYAEGSCRLHLMHADEFVYTYMLSLLNCSEFEYSRSPPVLPKQFPPLKSLEDR